MRPTLIVCALLVACSGGGTAGAVRDRDIPPEDGGAGMGGEESDEATESPGAGGRDDEEQSSDGGTGGDVASSGGAASGGDASGGSEPTGGSGGDACQCQEGPCCDGCHFRPTTYLCDEDRTAAAWCGDESSEVCASGKTRILEDLEDVYCSGVSAECDGETEPAGSRGRPCDEGDVCRGPDELAACEPC